MAPVPVALQWSGGKDAAHALGRLLSDDRYEVRCLVSLVTGAPMESSVHALPVHLLEAQADAIGLPLHTVAIAGPDLEGYAEVMVEAMQRLRGTGIRAIAFGDLEHSGALAYRQELFAPLGMTIIEPLWGMTSPECMERFLCSGIDAVTVVVNASVLSRKHLGVPLDEAFVAGLPATCDVSGELGEYHTFVWNAPYFRHPVRFSVGDTICIERHIGTTDGIKTFTYWQLRLD